MTRSSRTFVTMMIAAVPIAAAAAGFHAVPSGEPAVEATPSADQSTAVASHDARSAIADYARAHGLTGLSPASLAPIPDHDGAEYTNSYAVLSAIADHARAHGLTGLSPASLAPIPD